MEKNSISGIIITEKKLMALQKQITTISGAVTEYYRISEAMINYTHHKAYITVLAYLDSGKRNEEKAQATRTADRATLMAELDQMVANPTDENEARRIELSNQINALPEQTPSDVEPRNMFASQYEIDIPADTDFSLAFAYGWLKENIYVDATDV